MLLSICMITYNHERFVHQAIASVLEQEFPFCWELIISDDASTDNTATIIDQIVSTHPNIRFYLQPKNLGMHRNYEFVMERCTGEFVAQLEGDDYWTDPKKSIKQIALMRSHPKMMWSSTNGIEVDEVGQWLKDVNFSVPGEFTLQDFIRFSSISFNPLNNSIMFRKVADPLPYPDFVMQIIQVDAALHYLRAREGTIGFLSDSTLAYRRHQNSLNSRKVSAGARPYFDWITMYNGLRELMPKDIAANFDNRSAYFYISRAYLAEKNNKQFIRFWLKCIGYPTWRDSLHYLKLWLSGIYQNK